MSGVVFIRHSRVADESDAERRVESLRDELSKQTAVGGISVFRVENESDLLLVAALYTAKRDYVNTFPYFRVDDGLLADIGLTAPPIADGGSPFEWMRSRHHEVRDATDTQLDELARSVALHGVGKQVTKPRLTVLVKAEKLALTVTSGAEWEFAGKWTKAFALPAGDPACESDRGQGQVVSDT